MATLQICLSLLAVLLASTPTSALLSFELVKIPMTWQEASNYCKQNGIYGLLSFYSHGSWEAASELMTIQGVLEGHKVWTDGSKVLDGVVRSNFYYSFGSDIVNFDGAWYPGEPNNNGGQENCLLAEMVNGRLQYQDYDCNNQNQKFWFACNKLHEYMFAA